MPSPAPRCPSWWCRHRPTRQGGSSTTSSSTTTTTTAPSSTTTTIPVDQQIEGLVGEFGSLYEDSIPVLVNLYADHLADVANGGAGFFDAVEQEVMDLATERMGAGIRAAELNDTRLGLTSRPPPLFVSGLDAETRETLSEAGATVVVPCRSRPTRSRTATPPRTPGRRPPPRWGTSPGCGCPTSRSCVPVAKIDAVQLEAITVNGLLDPEPGTSRVAAAALGGLAVLLAALFLWRIAPGALVPTEEHRHPGDPAGDRRPGVEDPAAARRREPAAGLHHPGGATRLRLGDPLRPAHRPPHRGADGAVRRHLDARPGPHRVRRRGDGGARSPSCRRCRPGASCGWRCCSAPPSSPRWRTPSPGCSTAGPPPSTPPWPGSSAGSSAASWARGWCRSWRTCSSSPPR